MAQHVVIVGGSAAGLSTALLLARAGHQVDVLDGDDLEPAPAPEAAAKTAMRPAAPQIVHTHQHQPVARRILRERLPDVYAALLRAGAAESPLSDRMPPTLLDRSRRPGDEELTALQVRRSTFDWVLRMAVAGQADLRVHGRRRVTGLLAAAGDPPRVVGVATDDGPMTADVVVDATGRRTPAGRWLTTIGARPPWTATTACGIGYYTRHYRLPPGARRPDPGRLSLIAPLPYFTVAAVTGDDDTMTVTLSPPLADRPQRALRHPAIHGDVARTVTPLRPWIDIAEPTSDVYAMGGLRNTLRRLVVDGRPVALGLHAVGDAVCTTNPTLGRGLSLALLGATDLASGLAAHPDDMEAQAHAMDHAVTAHIEPWYTEGAAIDAARLRAVRHTLRSGSPAPLPDLAGGLTMAHIRTAAAVDPIVFRALTSVISMVRHPADLYTDPGVILRTHTVLTTPKAHHTAPGPTRAALLTALTQNEQTPPTGHGNA